MNQTPFSNSSSETFEALKVDLPLYIAKAPVAVAMFDRDLRHVAWSDLWAEHHGLDGQTLLGRTYYEVLPDASPRSREGHRRTLAGEATACDEDRIERADGSVAWERWRMNPIADASGTVVGFSVFVEDVTKRVVAEEQLRASDARLRLATEAAGFGLIEIDYKLGRSTVSGKFMTMLGLASGNETGDADSWISHVGEADRRAYQAAKAQAMDPQGDGRIAVDFSPEVGGRSRSVQFLGQVQFEGEGAARTPERMVGILLDMTERDNLQGALAGAQRLETVGRMAGTVAHDFNNLLTVIIANLELAGLRTTDEALTRYLGRSMEAAEMGANFNKRLLALAGGRRPKNEVLAIDSHIAGTWTLLQQALSEDSQLRFLPGARGATVTLDSAELDGALLNLIVNARDAQPSGGEIVVATDLVELDADEAAPIADGKAGTFVRVSVRDNGTGMPPEVARHAMEPFFTTKGPGRGTGLGLTSVATLAKRADGFVSLDTELGKGTTVGIYLPPADQAAEAAPEVDERMPFGDGELVLVVEDDQLVRETALQRLEAIGYAVLEASNADAALRLLDAGEPVDLVFSDVVMPGELSGYELADEVVRKFPGVGVLMTSGHVSKNYSNRRSANEEIELLEKPYSLSTLAAAVARAITLARQME